MAGARSIIVYGQPGSGKTALRRALEYRALSLIPARLIVHWRPTLPADALTTGTLAARTQLAQAMDACAIALLKHLADSPAAYGQAPDWAQQTLTWFIHRYSNDLPGQITFLSDRARGSSQALVRQLATRPNREILAADAPLDAVVARLTEALGTIGLEGIWVMADSVEGLTEIEPERLASALTAFLSCLAYFEQSPLFYKLTLPIALQSRLNTSSSIVRGRVFLHQLAWTADHLKQIVERRLALVTGKDDFKLGDIYSPSPSKRQSAQITKRPKRPKINPVQAWLAGCGGAVPRGWLNYASPLASACLQLRAQQQIRSLTCQEWLEARGRVPLMLSLDQQTGLVHIGWRTIDRLSPLEQSVLQYLMANHGRICTKEELYENAYLASEQAGLKASQLSETQPKLPERPSLKSKGGYNSVIDTVLWRLREAIEPDMDNPVFLLTSKGQGVVLHPQPFVKDV